MTTSFSVIVTHEHADYVEKHLPDFNGTFLTRNQVHPDYTQIEFLMTDIYYLFLLGHLHGYEMAYSETTPKMEEVAKFVTELQEKIKNIDNG